MQAFQHCHLSNSDTTVTDFVQQDSHRNVSPSLMSDLLFDRGLIVLSLAMRGPLMDSGGLAASQWASDSTVKKGIIVCGCPCQDRAPRVTYQPVTTSSHKQTL